MSKNKKIKISKRAFPIHTDTVIVSARVPKSLIEKIDKLCKRTGRSRSDVVGQILNSYFSEYVEVKLDKVDFDTTD